MDIGKLQSKMYEHVESVKNPYELARDILQSVRAKTSVQEFTSIELYGKSIHEKGGKDVVSVCLESINTAICLQEICLFAHYRIIPINQNFQLLIIMELPLQLVFLELRMK